MKNSIILFIFFILFIMILSTGCNNQGKVSQAGVGIEPAVSKHLFLDVHNLEPGKVTFEGVAGAHQKDLATEGKYDVNFIKYWVDESLGKVYCLVEAPDSAAVYLTHKEAHGLVPDLVSPVSDGPEAQIQDANSLYFDVHHLGAGKVTAKAVADAHAKDLATQGKFNVKFINYWVDEKDGVVVCLSEAKDPQAIIRTHTEAHGLVPDEIHKVKQGE
jgi:hypothetical protein